MVSDQVAYILHELFAGRATPLQKKLVEAWLHEPGNEEVYYRYVAKWEAEHGQYDPDTTTALTAYEAFLAGKQPYPTHQPVDTSQQPTRFSIWHNPRWRWAAAAAVTLLLGIRLTQPLWQYRQYEVPYGHTQTVRLADGTLVTLNAHSTLRMSRFGFRGSDREVWLDGEAYFSVVHTADNRRFVVHTNRVDVLVLGTKFNVNTRQGQTEVVLNEGRVQLLPRQQTTDKHPLLMKPGEQVTLAEGDTAFRRLTLVPEQVAAWRQNKLVFNETPLSQVAQKIEDFYGIRVVLANRELARRELTGTLPNNDLNVVLKTLVVSYNVAVERQHNCIVLH